MPTMLLECGPCACGRKKRLFLLIVGQILYVGFGALVFSALESRNEHDAIESLRRQRADFADKINPLVSGRLGCAFFHGLS